MKVPIFLEVVSATEILQEPQSNLEENVNPSIIKDDSSSRTDPSVFTSIAPVKPRLVEFFQHQKSTSHFLPQSSVSQISIKFRSQF